MADQGLTVEEIILRAQDLAEVGGYAQTARPPLWLDLFKRAYTEFVWETDCRRVSDTFVTVSGQIEHTLTTPYWKVLLDVIYNTGTNAQPLEKSSDAEIRRMYDDWLVRDAGTPDYWYWVRPNVLGLFPKPDTSNITVTIYGVRGPEPITDISQYPAIQGVYHEALAERMYTLVALQWARGDERRTLLAVQKDYLSWLGSCRAIIGAGQVQGTERRVPTPVADRVCL